MIHIERAEELSRSLSKLNQQSPLGVDCETTGLDPFTSIIRTIQISDGKFTLVIDVRKIGNLSAAYLLEPILTNPKQIKIFHNSKFDLKFIKHHLNLDVEGIYDTFLASQIIECGVTKPKGYHGLEQVAPRYTDKILDKTEQVSDWSGELSQSQLKYAAEDAECLLAIREAQIEILKNLNLVRCAKLEFDAVLPIVWLELSGFHLDIDQWMSIAEENKKEADKVAESIYMELLPHMPQGNLFGADHINLDSWQQVDRYFRLAGVPMPAKTKEWMLLPLVDKYPIVQKLLDYRGFHKSYTSFGEKFKEFINPVTGRIHSNFFQIGAETGRMSSSEPNLQQLPSETNHRKCFKAGDGNKLLGFDFSQIELRILADLSKDKVAIKAFQSKVDYHRAMAAQVFKKNIEDVDSEERSFAKRLNFGIPYGIGAARFAMQASIPEIEAQMIMNNFFSTVKQEKRWLDYQKYNILKTKTSRTASGRMWLADFDEADWQSRSKAQRNALNFPIQGSSADILKRSLRLVYDRTKLYHDDLKLVNVVHDELDFEIKEDLINEVGDIIHKAMVEAGQEFIKSVEIVVDRKISDVWAK